MRSLAYTRFELVRAFRKCAPAGVLVRVSAGPVFPDRGAQPPPALTIALLYASGVSLGVTLSAERWLEMTGLIIVALIPFAALGILLGHLLTADSIGPAIGGLVSLLALVSGTWFPIGSHGILHDIGQFLPSYWLVRASHIGVGGQAWTATGWIVIAASTMALATLARFAYRRDTGRV